ncbi:hypothetical protein FA13DRAFT_611058 [Coprinellus micaceus]|uniref:Uncharacterized protein n=1 Tax=Coprinellus micaceus TaxID=71717 RepID=A0A4Y7SAJ4_COPMI|nr:hypothetical protein FA13DRAFT_611058 [Coprinellus micaceus]
MECGSRSSTMFTYVPHGQRALDFASPSYPRPCSPRAPLPLELPRIYAGSWIKILRTVMGTRSQRIAERTLNVHQQPARDSSIGRAVKVSYPYIYSSLSIRRVASAPPPPSTLSCSSRSFEHIHHPPLHPNNSYPLPGKKKPLFYYTRLTTSSNSGLLLR